MNTTSVYLSGLRQTIIYEPEEQPVFIKTGHQLNIKCRNVGVCQPLDWYRRGTKLGHGSNGYSISQSMDSTGQHCSMQSTIIKDHVDMQDSGGYICESQGFSQYKDIVTVIVFESKLISVIVIVLCLPLNPNIEYLPNYINILIFAYSINNMHMK